MAGRGLKMLKLIKGFFHVRADIHLWAATLLLLCATCSEINRPIRPVVEISDGVEVDEEKIVRVEYLGMDTMLLGFDFTIDTASLNSSEAAIVRLYLKGVSNFEQKISYLDEKNSDFAYEIKVFKIDTFPEYASSNFGIVECSYSFSDLPATCNCFDTTSRLTAWRELFIYELETFIFSSIISADKFVWQAHFYLDNDTIVRPSEPYAYVINR
jgi:hypothetical protein